MLMVAFIAMLMVTGCTGYGQVKTKSLEPLTPEIWSRDQTGWWSASFRINWPPDTEASWHLDLLVAHQIILPVLQQHPTDIALWRFHRRAARDDAGHRFSFIFYAPQSSAYTIFEKLIDDPLLNQMRFSGLIVEERYDDPNYVTKPNIEDTSDSHWSPVVQKNWPYYIMGVSQMWINMITSVAGELPDLNQYSSITEVEEFYQRVNTRLTEIWQREGRHAYLHHLNALFGYKPLIYYEKRYLIF